MAPSKRKGGPSSRAPSPKRRKRKSTRATSKQPRKYTEPSDSEGSQGINDEAQEWKADCILQERRRNGRLEYLVKWDCIDPKTGEVYEPEWLLAELANEPLVAEWAEVKAKRNRAGSGLQRATLGSAASARGKAQSRTQRANTGAEAQPPTPHRPQPARKSQRARVVESSPEPDTPRPSNLPPASSTPPAPAAQSSGPATRTSPRIRIASRGGSFQPADFDVYSQIADSRLQTQDSNLDSSQLFAAARTAFSSGIVPDSESSAGEASYVLPTQASGTQQQSSNTTGGQENEAEDEEDSGLLDIARQTPRAPSPAPSIPETIPDTEVVEDEQSQRRRAEELEQEREVLDTVEGGEGEEQAVQPPIEESITQEEIIVLSSVKGVLQPAQENTSQAIVQTERQQEDESHTQDETTIPESTNTISHPTQEIITQSIEQTESEQDESTTQDPPNASEKKTVLSGGISARIHNDHVQELQFLEKEQVVGGINRQNTVVEKHGPEPSQLIGRDIQTTEQSTSQDVSQFPFHSQFPLYDVRLPQQQTSVLLTDKPEVACERDVATTELSGEVEPVSQHPELPVYQSEEGTTISEGSHSESQSLLQPPSKPGLNWRTRPGYLPNGFLQSQDARSPSPSAIQSELSPVALVHDVLQSVTPDRVERRDFAPHSQPRSTGQSTQSHTQNAQIVQTDVYLSVQEDTTESLLQTVEVENTVTRSRSSSRHDSSQETPERSLKSSELSSSPIPQHPDHSLNTFESNVPPRFTTPAPTSSESIMASQDTSKAVEQRLKEMMAKKQAENPFTPSRRRLGKSSASPASTPTPTVPEGTRSPSAVPDKAPVPQVQTSLRTVVFVNSRDVPVKEPAKETETLLNATTQPERTITPRPEQTATVRPQQSANSRPEEAAPIAATKQADVPLEKYSSIKDKDEEFNGAKKSAEIRIENEELSDDGDTESLLNDDLSLEHEEYVVPLFIDGRQSSMYTEHIKHKKDLLEGFLRDPQDFEPFAEVDGVLDLLKAIETHVDLVFAEAESTDMYSATQIEHAAQFGVTNSVKFKFLHTLFHNLRDSQKHIVLIIEKSNDALFSIIETFCKAKFINYSMPTKGKQADPGWAEGDLTVTVFSSGDSLFLGAADLIICLDGVQQAKQIRRKYRFPGPDLGLIVPIIHLVIPRTVGHIERYISSTLNNRKRVHTILASLAQIRGEIGKAIDQDTPRAMHAAALVADWLIAKDKDTGLNWPLPSIGSIKDVIEFQTQMSQASTTASPAPERAKRPLENGDFDPAKRMRFTPQPQTMSSSSLGIGNEITHVSDSMPCTAVDEASRLHKQLARLQEAYKQERAARKKEEQRFREHEAMWDNQQTIHEDQTRDYRVLLNTSKSMEAKLEKAMKNNETLRERLAARTLEMQTFSVQLEEQRNTSLLDENERIVEITRLRKDLAQAQLDRDHALKSAKSTEALHEYTKEQYRLAQEAASRASSRITALEAENVRLTRQASGEAARLKAIHLDRHAVNMAQLLKSETASNANLKKIISQKDDEIVRLRNAGGARVGVGTRASVTPQPKTRSRAASPSGGRLSNLRNG